MKLEELRLEIRHQEELAKQHKKTCRILELQVAKLNLYAPPHMIQDLEECKERIQQCKREIDRLRAQEEQLLDAERRSAKHAALVRSLDHVKLIEDRSIPLAQRLENAHLLGPQDRRIGVCTLPDSVDDPYWCRPFPKRQYQLATGQPAVELQAFRVARYPTTVWQFQKFVDGGGYSNRQWWGKSRQPSSAADEFGMRNVAGWNAANQPVIGISWYEATAFCRWLTAYSRKAGWLPAQLEIRLPTEAEWIIAAMWDADTQQLRKWHPPAGVYWQNVREVSVFNKKTSPVGLFPEGASPCGALDMAGNVWEWCCSSRDAFPVLAHGIRRDVEPSARDLVLRGGSWMESNQQSGWEARSPASLPTTTLKDRGFRVVLSSVAVP